ncbi:MAG TPA: hypothetical protein VN957_10680 [Chthoniobacterales bacterium]|nr:hypothetical protein [Chthoniobacterales bacterium]
MRRAIRPIREAEPKESAKDAQTKNNGLKCFMSFLSQPNSSFVIRFFHAIFLRFAYRLIAECQINARSLRAAAIVPVKDPKKTAQQSTDVFLSSLLSWSKGDICCVDDKILAQFLSWPARASP